MNTTLRNRISDFLSDQVAAFGFAPVTRFDKAPEAHHPERLLKDAQTVVVFGMLVPKGILHSPDYHLYAMHRSYHTVYQRIDSMTLDLCNFIEAAANAYAVPVPSYAPMKFHGMEPWGLLSLKHAAVNAGLGAIGRNGLMHHPAFGTMLRLGAVVTDVPLPESDLQDSFPCPEKCRACHQACPPGAFNDAGQFAKLTCMGQTIKHAIYPLALKDEHGLKHLERIINTAGHNYWLTCNACLSVCPNNRKKAE